MPSVRGAHTTNFVLITNHANQRVKRFRKWFARSAQDEHVVAALLVWIAMCSLVFANSSRMLLENCWAWFVLVARKLLALSHPKIKAPEIRVYSEDFLWVTACVFADIIPEYLQESVPSCFFKLFSHAAANKKQGRAFAPSQCHQRRSRKRSHSMRFSQFRKMRLQSKLSFHTENYR